MSFPTLLSDTLPFAFFGQFLAACPQIVHLTFTPPELRQPTAGYRSAALDGRTIDYLGFRVYGTGRSRLHTI